MVICVLGAAFRAAGSELQVLVKDQSGRPVESAESSGLKREEKPLSLPSKPRSSRKTGSSFRL